MALGIIHNFIIDERETGNPNEDDEREMELEYAADLEREKRTKNKKSLDPNLEIEEDENISLNGQERLSFQIEEFKRINAL
jgi:hypothetical protein